MEEVDAEQIVLLDVVFYNNSNIIMMLMLLLTNKFTKGLVVTII